MKALKLIRFKPFTVDNFKPYGWPLGKPIRLGRGAPAFQDEQIDFRHEHTFEPGVGGETEVLWVNYRNTQRSVQSLEAHLLCQQALVPLTGEVTHIVAAAQLDGSPDLDTLSAFRIPVGQGICMRPGCWHTSRVASGEVTCLMLTRSSTTIDLAAHLLNTGSPLAETAIAVVAATLPPEPAQ